MTAPADRIFTNAEVHTLGERDKVHEAVAVRDGEIVRVDSAYEIEFLNGVETEVVDCEGGVLLPGFIDAHTHMETTGRYLVHADLSADSRGAALSTLADHADATDDEWILGYGYDETQWNDDRFLFREDLDAVTRERPVVAFREDMHTASVNSVVLDLLEFPEEGVERVAGEPTGVLREEAVDVLYEATEADVAETRELLVAARDRAWKKGVTAVHDMVRDSKAPRVYRELDRAGELGLRVRLNYWATHLDAVEELGLVTNHGSGLVEMGGIKTYTDGTFGGRTAKVSEAYEDGGTGQWVVDPDQLEAYVARAHSAGLQFCAHAIGDEAVEAVLDAYEGRPGRHRIEHAELLRDDLIERLSEEDVVASVQPNFLKWAREGGLYERALGRERTRETNQYGALLDAGVPLAFGSDCMPLDPLLGVAQAVTAPDDRQRLSVTEALQAYTSGAAYAGFAEDRLGTIEPGKRADLVLLEESPWELSGEEIAEIDVTMTVVDGAVVHKS
ncbi:amidohydrolase [Natronomonas sp. EA1]|uniref:amidohydrolase n=1 Tax=Natronomonas sp. EA1 TaxID=3421655 RepID=UPI003EB7E294